MVQPNVENHMSRPHSVKMQISHSQITKTLQTSSLCIAAAELPRSTAPSEATDHRMPN
jgi:hypothetical protein